MKLTHQNLKDYFKQLHDQYVEFQANSFFRINITEIAGAFSRDATYPCMVIEAAEGNLGKSNEISTIASRTPAFTIYMNPDDHDYDAQDAALDKCEAIGLKILARMKHDSLDPNHLLYDKFDKISWSWIQVGPIFTEKLYGYRFLGTFDSNESLQVDHNDWKDLDNNCLE